MARPLKEGFDYFPFDVNLDDKVRAVESVFKNNGFVWIVKFWMAAYKTNDGEISLDNYSGVIQAENSRITQEEQKSIIEMCIEIGLIYRTESGKYTSNGIKKRIAFLMSEREKWRKKNKIELSPKITPGIMPEEPVKESKEKNINTCPFFVEFWKIYPRKEGKAKAIQAWKKIKSPSETLELIKIALSWQTKTDQWVKEHGQFIPHPTTYLNANRWLDEKIEIKDTKSWRMQ